MTDWDSDGYGCEHVDGDGRNMCEDQVFAIVTKLVGKQQQQQNHQRPSQYHKMSITTTIIFATCLLSFLAFTHGAKNGLLRKKSFTVVDDSRIKNFNKHSLSDSDVQSAFRELMDNSNQMKWDSSMSLSMSMSTTFLPSLRPGASTESTVFPVVALPSLRPGASTEPTVYPMVVKPPMTQVNPVVTNTKSTGEKQPKVSRGGLSGGVIAGTAVAAVAVVAVAAILAKKGPTSQASVM